MENEKKEIDLIDALKSLFEWIWNVIKRAVSALGWMTRLIFHEKRLVLIFMVLGILFGFYVSRTKVYRGEVELRINAHDSYFYKNMIDPLYNQCKYRDMEAIAKHFGMSEKEASNIINVQSFYYVDVLSDGTPNYVDYEGIFNASDTTDMIMPDRLRIIVDCTDLSMFDKLEDSFNYFFSQNPQIVKENNLRKRHLNEKISAVEKEIDMLDSLRKREYFVRKRDVELSTDKMVVVEREIKLYHNEILSLENQKQQLVWDRDVFEDGVSFSSHFETNPHPINNWLKQIIFFGLIFSILGTIVAMLKVNRKNISEYLKRGV